MAPNTTLTSAPSVAAEPSTTSTTPTDAVHFSRLEGAEDGQVTRVYSSEQEGPTPSPNATVRREYLGLVASAARPKKRQGAWRPKKSRNHKGQSR